MLPRILVKVYKEDAVVWFPSGQTRNISCNHQYLGLWGINMLAEEVPVSTTTIPPAVGTGESNQSAGAIIAIGGQWVDLTQFGDSGFKVCVKVKDIATGIVSYIDAEEYAANIGLCNTVSYVVGGPGTCATPGSLFLSTASTSIGLSWGAVTGAGAYEVAIVQSPYGVQPNDPTSGTVITTTSHTFTGLISGTWYWLFVRTICQNGAVSAWAVVQDQTS